MGRIINTKSIPKIKNAKIVVLGGCFDILHRGHIDFLKKAKKLGDILFIILESDLSVKKLKGDLRPINKQRDRAIVLSSLEFVDYVLCIPYFVKDEDYFELVKKIEPDIIAVTDNDPWLKEKTGQAKIVGGKVIEVMKKNKNYSTSKILNNIR